MRIKPINPRGDKYTRSLDLSEAWNAGNLLLPDPNTYPEKRWLIDYIDEFEVFTGINDPHDDQIDASVMAFNQLQAYGTSVFVF